MANHYLTSSFVLEMSTEDAEMVRLAQRASEALSDLADEVSYADLGPRFSALFPPKDGDDFGSFLDLFDDRNFPSFDCDISIDTSNAEGCCAVSFNGSNFGVEQVAKLIFTACKSALPCAFSWAFTCDRLRPDEFGGGCPVITEAGINIDSTPAMVGRALAAAAILPFDPACVAIEHKRFSVTQGEVLVSYNGQRIEQYGDRITLIGKDWEGYPDAFWIAVAYREAIARSLAKRLPVPEEAAIMAHLPQKR
ncbi:hypothetical protein [Novosphingobium album (ex Hu et al. 2023)]|uniref:Uncharacterized protein n=1 Tax=Novosphingobium album (ex Hu et al. 2023) TaxID=2930093 RepID=A0ABT0B510_9SPHN|nr:hypothetical protein [Novosphingobium album (ex Hu et al. 2023)]MCJ2180177.1 hypothetical protein [Novosphingobium album (ex Hu et al. 2023)]